jgi:hypothetical protein
MKKAQSQNEAGKSLFSNILRHLRGTFVHPFQSFCCPLPSLVSTIVPLGTQCEMPRKFKRDWKEKAARAHLKTPNEKTALYEPLDDHDREIRLVTIKQGRFEDTIHCDLSKASLRDEPAYEALSYTWGDLTSPGQIYLNGRPYQVTKNLESALQYLRLVAKPRVLWIDALCINQKDIPERNSQVMHMNGIYREALEVVAWVGEEGDDSDLAFDAFEGLPTDESAHWNPEIYPRIQNMLHEPRYAIAINMFFQRSWWHRVWTVQESVLPKTLHFVCGYRQISADRLFAINNCYFIHAVSCCWGILEYFEVANSFNLVETLDATRGTVRSASIEELLADYRGRHCTDPRDKVYGLLGIAGSEDTKLIVPNYLTSVPEVYEQVALKLLERTNKLKLFSQLYPQWEAGTVATRLPSWVPDWTSDCNHNQYQSINIRFEMTGYYAASAGSSAQIRSIKQGKIALRGILFSSCAAFGKPNTGKIKSIHSPLDVFRLWPDLARITTDPNRSYASDSSTTYYNAYWQTLCASLLPPQSALVGRQKLRTSNHSYGQAWFEAWCNAFKLPIVPYSNTLPSGAASSDPTSEVTAAEISAFYNFVFVATAGRKLFISKEEGWLGLAPMQAEVGDRIALLKGGNVPYILRPKLGEENEWEIIGDAYVHGIMDGEGWKPDELVDIILV